MKPSFFSVLEEAAADIPDKPLFVFPETRWFQEETLTYGDLTLRASAAACRLREELSPGDRALLLYPTGAAFWEAFMGCLAAGVIAVPLKVPNPNRSSEALEHVINNCTPSVVLTDEATADLFTRRAERHPYLQKLPVVTCDSWRGSGSHTARPQLSQGGTAFLQYTSGSTSRPKGVQISHQNLVTNTSIISDRMGISTGVERCVTWLPHYHDMGLVGTCLVPMLAQMTTWCLPPEEFALYPERWLQLITEHRCTMSAAPDFAYKLCVDRLSDDQLVNLDLSSWRVAVNGAERVRPDTLRLFARQFSQCGFNPRAFFPCYGLAEGTLMVTGGPVETDPRTRHVSRAALLRNEIAPASSEHDRMELAGSGQTFERSPVVIVDPVSRRQLDENQIGEIMVAGMSVTDGYFNQSELNDDLLVELPDKGQSMRFLKTGDLGFLSDGELFVTGRIREMMIVRGRNLSPEDVEGAACLAHEAVVPSGVVAFSVDVDGQESLIVAVELQRSFLKQADHGEVARAIRHGVIETLGVNPAEVVLLRPASILRTSSGKPKRLQLRASYLKDDLSCLFRDRQARN